jgi:allatostatin receptor
MFQVRTERNALTAIGVTWIVILLVSMPVYVSHGEITYTFSSSEHTACVFLERDPVNRPDGYNKPVFQVHLLNGVCVAGNPASLINTSNI